MESENPSVLKKRELFTRLLFDTSGAALYRQCDREAPWHRSLFENATFTSAVA
jgi:hypothetical protein